MFCARPRWVEELRGDYVAGAQCSMENPRAVSDMPRGSRCAEKWELIANASELTATSVTVAASNKLNTKGPAGRRPRSAAQAPRE